VQERKLHLLLAEAEAKVPLPLSTEALNAMLVECGRCRDQELASMVERAGVRAGVERTGRTYELLIRATGNDVTRISALLKEIRGKPVDLGGVASSVLAACCQQDNSFLADQLYEVAIAHKDLQTTVLMAVARYYSEHGHPEKACQIFDTHLKETCSSPAPLGITSSRRLLDSHTQRCLVGAALRCGREDVSTCLLESAPTEVAKHINTIRGLAKRGNLTEALSIFRALEASGAELTPSFFNIVLDACVECRDVDQAEQLMRKMLKQGKADAVSYNTMIKAHLRRESYSSARALMEEMRRSGHTPNHVTYNELIKQLAQSEGARRSQVWDVVDEMTSAGVRPNHVTCSILLKSLKAKSSEQDIIRTMELADNTDEPVDEVLLSSIVEACVRIGKPSLLTAKLKQLHGQGDIQVTGAHTFGSLIKAYGHARDINGAWRCWKEMRSQHVKPTCITIGCMVEAVVTNGDVDGGYELIMDLLEDDQCKDQVNAVVFGSVLKGYSRARRMERVWTTFQEMLARGIEPSVATFNTIVDGCTRSGQMEKVLGLLLDMKSRGLQPNLVTYSTVIKGFCQHGDLPAALEALAELRASGLQPDEIVYNTLLDGCLQASLVHDGERLFRQMQQEGVHASNYTLTVMVKLMGQARRVDRAFEIVEMSTRRFRFRPNAHVCNALVQACLLAKDTNRAAEAYEQMVRDRIGPDPRVCHALVRALLQAGSLVRAVSIVRAATGINGGWYTAGSDLEDTFLSEMLSLLVAKGNEGVPLAKALLADLQSVRPKLKVDLSVERRLAAR